MLSSLSSFLPASLTEKLEKLDLHGTDSGGKVQADDEGVKRRDMAEDVNKKEKKKKPSSNETFIVVRPPPAKSNHPLNLQLQLVPAHHSRDRSNTSAATTPTNSRFSVDVTHGNDSAQSAEQAPPSPASSEAEQGLKRSSSIRSNRSEASAFYASPSVASTGSVTSFASTASNSSGRRMIIPLYNLSAHNVMTNTILDAGTDARVAKFLKRGLEIIDLAILEPTEVWNGPTGGKEITHGAGVGAASDPLGVPIHRSISGNSSLAPPGQSGSRAGTPEPFHSPGSSRLSLSSDHSSSASHHPPNEPVGTTAPTPTGAKKLFGRMFRKKDSGQGHTRSTSIPSVPPGILAAPSAPMQPPPSPKRTTTNLPETGTPAKPRQATEVLLPAVLGLSPTLSAATNPPTGRCISYVWVVRRWLKVENQGLISGVLGKIGREASAHGLGHVPEPAQWEIRFEWVRSKTKGEKARHAARRASVDMGGKSRSRTPSRRNSKLMGLEDLPNPQLTSDGLAILIDSPRQSLDVVPGKRNSRAASPRRPPVTAAAKAVSVASTTPSEDDQAGGAVLEDDGDESDPEDSETPWTCTLVLRHPAHPAPPTTASSFAKGHSRTRTVSSSGAIFNPTTPTPSNIHAADGAAPAPIRLKVATLAPAPHHPKVVCQLKIPFPLPDVEVTRGVLRKRLVLGDGSTRSTVPRDQTSGEQALTMTAEEIKDVVCSTAFWVVVREGFGGLGKKNRKGDGWKIRG